MNFWLFLFKLLFAVVLPYLTIGYAADLGPEWLQGAQMDSSSPGARSTHHQTLNRIEDLVDLLEERDLLLLDIDQTLLVPGRRKYQDPVKAVEKDIDDTIRRLRAKGVIVLGLTARDGSRFADKTHQQLRSINVDLSSTIDVEQIAPDFFEKKLALGGGGHGLFKGGIIYAKRPRAKSSIKGEVLLAFLDFFDLSKAEQKHHAHWSKKPGVRILDVKKIKRVILVDDQFENNDSFIQAFSKGHHSGIKPLSFIFKPPAQAVKKTLATPKKLYEYKRDDSVIFPSRLTELKYRETLTGGSGGVHIMTDHSGRIYTLKCNSGDLNHFKEELAADAMVIAAGAKAPSFAIYDHRPQDPSLDRLKCPYSQPFYRLAEFIPSTKTESSELIRQGFRKRFLVDALMANWDVVVGAGKNVILSKDDEFFSIDHGGALRYRALGKKKDISVWKPNEIVELTSFLDPNKNKDGASIYKDIPQDDLKQQAQQLFARRLLIAQELKRINSVIDIEDIADLQRMIADRIIHLYRLYLKPVDKEIHKVRLAHTFDEAIPGETSAGVFVYANVLGDTYTMLGKRRGHDWWGNLGGKSDHGDKFLSATAYRETFEESNKLINLTQEELDGCASHDLVDGNKLYRMYFFPHKYVNAKSLLGALGSTGEHSDEYTDFAWVKVADLIRAVAENNAITEEGQETISLKVIADPERISSKEFKSIIIHPPLLKMLRQRPVLKTMSDIINKRPLKPLHTRGEAEKKMSPISIDGGIDEMMVKTTWPLVNVKALSTRRPLKNDFVPLGQTALGEVVQQRETIVGKKGADESSDTVADQVIRSADQESEQLKRSILKKALAMAELKSKNEIEPYESAINDEMKNKLANKKLTQSEIYFSYRMKDKYRPVTDENADTTIPQNLFRFFSEVSYLSDEFTSSKKSSPIDSHDHPFIKAMSQAWQEERRAENRGRIFAYHGTDPMIAILYDLFTEIRRQLMIEGLNDTVVTRSLDSAFEGIFTVDEFIREQAIKQSILDPSKLSNYSEDYRQKALSANLFIGGSDGNKTSSTALYVFSGYSKNPPDHKKILNFFKGAMEVDFNDDEFIQIAKTYNIDKSGRLLQFIYEPEIAEDLVYASLSGGRVRNFNTPLSGYVEGYHGAFGLIDNIRTDVDATLAAMDNSGIDSLQLRLFMEPYKALNPSLVKIKQYYGVRPSEQDILEYRGKLRTFAKQIVADLEKNQIKPMTGMLRSVDITKDGLTPIQRLAKYITEGEAGRSVEYKLSDPMNSMITALYKGDAALFRSAVQRSHAPISLVAPLIYRDVEGKEHSFIPLVQAYKNNYAELLDMISKHYLSSTMATVNDELLLIAENVINGDDEEYVSKMVEFLFRHGARLDENRGKNVLTALLKNKQLFVALCLINKGVSDSFVTREFIEKNRLWEETIKAWNLEFGRYLLARAGKPHSIDEKAAHLYMQFAIRDHKNIETIRFLLENNIIYPSEKMFNTAFYALQYASKPEYFYDTLQLMVDHVDRISLAEAQEAKSKSENEGSPAHGGRVLYLPNLIDGLEFNFKILNLIVDKLDMDSAKRNIQRLYYRINGAHQITKDSSKGWPAALMMLLTRGFDPNTSFRDYLKGYLNLLEYANGIKDNELIQMLLQRGATPIDKGESRGI